MAASSLAASPHQQALATSSDRLSPHGPHSPAGASLQRTGSARFGNSHQSIENALSRSRAPNSSSTAPHLHPASRSARSGGDDAASDAGSARSAKSDMEDDYGEDGGSCGALCEPPLFAEALKYSSMFVLSGENPVRVFVYNATKHKIFEAFVILLILANCAVLAMERPLEPEPSYKVPVEIFFTVAFTVEMLLKWVALGVFAHPGSYIRNPWNVLDFVIVVFSYLSFHPSVGNLTAFRVLRVMRPLRSMNAVRGLQVLVIGLLSSMKGLVHVGILSFFSILIFAILGVQLFGGKFRVQCHDIATGEMEEEAWCNSNGSPAGYWGFSCPEGYECREGTNPFYGFYHFDNVLFGMLTSFTIVTFDDWTKALDASIATVGAISFFYYFFAIIMTAYFVPNLVLAVINDEFVKASEEADQKDRDKLAMEQRLQQQQELKRIAVGPNAGGAQDAVDAQEAEAAEAAEADPLAHMTPEERDAYYASCRYTTWYRWERFRDALHDLTEGYPRLDSPFLEELLEIERRERERIRNEKIAERRQRIERARGETSSEDGGKTNAASAQSPRTRRANAPLSGALSDGVSEDGTARSRGATDAELLSPQEQAEKEILEEEDDEDGEPPTTVFQKVIIVFILLNTVVLASQHYNQPLWLDDAQTWANRALFGIFAVEFIMRVTALFPKRYVMDAFNVLDGLVVIISAVELGLSGSSTVSVFRALRLLRILKLLRSFPSLRQIIQVTLIAVKDTSYLLLIIALYLFIVALVGMQFFAGALQDTRMVFDDFAQSFYTVFQILTFDGWVPLMYESMHRTSDAAVTYYVAQIVLGNYVLLSLFLSILLSSFDSLEQSAGDVVNENAIVYTLFDMSVAQTIFGRGAASKEELAEASWVEPSRVITLNPHMQREYNRACHFFNKEAQVQPGTDAPQLDASRSGAGPPGAHGSGFGHDMLSDMHSDGGFITTEPTPSATQAMLAKPPLAPTTRSPNGLGGMSRTASRLAPPTLAVSGVDPAGQMQLQAITPTHSGEYARTPDASGKTSPLGATPSGHPLQAPLSAKPPGHGSAPHGHLSAPHSPSHAGLEGRSADTSFDGDQHQHAHAQYAAGGGAANDLQRRRSSLKRLAQPRGLFEIDTSRTLGGQKRKQGKLTRKNSEVSHDEPETEEERKARRKRELLGLPPQRGRASSRSSTSTRATSKGKQAGGDDLEPGVTLLASAPVVEEKKKKENPEDIYCPVCRQEMPVPLPSAPLVMPPTRKELHKVQCHFISVRLAKTHVLNALTDIVAMYMKEATPPKMKYVDPVVGQAWQVGLLLSETSESFVGAKDGWERLMAELDEERDILELRVGEEQLGRSLIAYALGNVPTEHKTNGGYSCFIFGPRNPVRVFISQVVQNPWFDRVILALILLNTVAMALDNPLDDQESTKVKTLFWLSVGFTACFTVEMIMKIIAFGLIVHEGAYLRDAWNILDGFIVVVSLLGYALADLNIGFLRVFRTLRALRPLRVINRNRGLKMVVRTLLESVKGIVNVGLICGINYLIFGILAVQFFGGRFQSCTDEEVLYKAQCNGTYFNEAHNATFPRVWRTEQRHFDDIYSSMLTLFEVSSGEWWGPVLYRAIDACGEDVGPQLNCNLVAGLFFIVFFSVTGFFLINLFVGVVIHNFKLVKEQMDGSSFMTPEQKLWVSTQQLMLNFRPAVAMKPRPGSAAAEVLFARVLSRGWFDVVIGIAIFANIIAIAIDHHGMSSDLEFGLSMLNLVFVVIFLVEAALKLFCFGLRYFRSGWNQFDFFLVVVSIIGVIFTFSGNGVGVDVNVLRVFRIFRILRVMRLVRQAKKIRILLETLWYSLPSMGNIGAFILLVDFIYGVLGVDLFAKLDIPDNSEILNHQLVNFRRLDNALMLLFRFQTTEEWNGAMHDCMIEEPYCSGEGCGTPWAPLYFVSHLVITAFVITNLLIAIILDNFETTMKLDNSALRMTDLNRFVEIWSEFDDDANMTVPTASFPQLLAQLQPPLGLTRVQSRKELLSQTAKYRIPEHGGFIHFIETLIPLARTVKLEEEGEGQLQLTDFEVREHEAMWRVNFPHLDELPTLRYREHTVTVDQYYCSTYIGAAYRARVAMRKANVLRYDKLVKIMDYCDEHDISYESVPYVKKFMDFYVSAREEQQRMRDEEEETAAAKAAAKILDQPLPGADKEKAQEQDKKPADDDADKPPEEEQSTTTINVEAKAGPAPGADRHYRHMSWKGQIPGVLKRAARDHARRVEDRHIRSQSLQKLDNGMRSRSTSACNSPLHSSGRSPINHTQRGSFATSSITAGSPMRYRSAIEAEEAAAADKRRKQIPLKRSTNRKRLSADASAASAASGAFGSSEHAALL